MHSDLDNNHETLLKFRYHALEEFKERGVLSSFSKEDIDRFETDDTYTNGFLLHGAGNFLNATSVLEQCLTWRVKFNVRALKQSSFSKSLLEKGIFYYHGKDLKGHALFHFAVANYVRDEVGFDNASRLLVWLLEQHSIKDHSRLTVIFDLTGTGLKNVDMEMVQYLITCFKVYFPNMLECILAFNMPWILNAAWKVIKTWLSPDARAKLVFVNNTSIKTFVGDEFLPPHMGGVDKFKYNPDRCTESPIPSSTRHVTFFDTRTDVNKEDAAKGDVVRKDSIIHNNGIDKTESSCRHPAIKDYAIGNNYSNGDNNVFCRKKNKKGLAVKKPEHDEKTLFFLQHMGPESVLNPTIAEGNLIISPSDELVFDGDKSSDFQIIDLTNSGDKYIVFKVKTTSPDNYRVRPGYGSVEPNSKAQIKISPNVDSLTKEAHKDKFLILFCEVDVLPENLANFFRKPHADKVYEHRLRCLFKTSENHSLSTPDSSSTFVTQEGMQSLFLDLQRKYEILKTYSDKLYFMCLLACLFCGLNLILLLYFIFVHSDISDIEL